MAGLALVGAMVGGACEARAGSVRLTGHIFPLPSGSPFLYEFDLYLTGGSIVASTTGQSEFTVGIPPGSGLVGVTTLSGTQQPPLTGNTSETWIVPSGGIVMTNTGRPAPYDQASSVEWEYYTGPTITYSGTPFLLGLFTVETTKSFPDNAPPITPGVTPIDWSYSILGSNGTISTGGGTITLALVPEPSSAILMLIGAAAVPVMLSRRRRRGAGGRPRTG